MLTPRMPVPNLSADLVGGGKFELSSDVAQFATLVVFYRGLHCPICVSYLRELERLTPQFAERGVKPIALSTDTQERTETFADKIGADNLRVGYGISLKKAREWGLYISTGRGLTSAGIEEPELFAEPGLFFVKPDGTLYFGNIQTMPFARPDFKPMLGALDFCIKNDYPARGEYTGAL
ncbi:AhpC/TSA family protein [Pseudovibrio axinellae]|uniref:AhpC/TSA family protein n=1 Tax=Pseudovibrio axinellae TaxID=989403 RepID=A0A166AME3_9HYPH|nr:peroxiredoxin-like family protein [Pseudovibrio axinellae]KZL21308.1 AhpC/TSA family protein [Pseudovibrio axinellae]SEQ95593.1 AhpC/TSA family protein [Pseudovibrio axinellae]